MSRKTQWERDQIAKATALAGAQPDTCHKCGNDQLEEHKGYVGETIVVCPICGVVWEDCGDAVRRVI